MAKKNKPEKGFYENGIYYEEMADISASANDHEGGISELPDDLLMSEKETQPEQDKLKGEIQALKSELRLKNEEIDELHRIIGEMYVEIKNRQSLL